MMVNNATTFHINARDNTSAAFRSAQNSIGGLGMAARSVAPLLGAIGGVAVLRGITRYTAETLKAADETIKMSRAAGLSAKTMQEMAHAANISGISTDALQKGLTRFNKMIGETKAGTGTMITLLRKMPDVLVDVERTAAGAAGGMKTVSVSLHDALVQAENSDQALDLMLTALTNMTDESKVAALAGAAFGRTMGPQMANLIMDGEKGIAELRAEAHRLGVVLDDSLLEGAEAANDAMDRMGKSVDSLGRQLVLSFAPAITATADAMRASIMAFRDGRAEMEKTGKQIQRLSDDADLLEQSLDVGLNLTELIHAEALLSDTEAEISRLETAISDLQPAINSVRKLSAFGLMDENTIRNNQIQLKRLSVELVDHLNRREDLLKALGRETPTILITNAAYNDQADAVDGVDAEISKYIETLREDARVNALSAREKKIHNAVREAEKRGIIDVNNVIAAAAGRLYDEAEARKKSIAATKEQKKALAGVREEYEKNLYADSMLSNQEAANRHASIRKWREYKESVMGDIDGIGDKHKEVNDALPDHTQAATSAMSKIWDNAVQSMQSSFSDTIYSLLWDKGVNSFKDFGKAIVDIFKKAVAEMVAAWATSKITNWLGGAFPGLSGGGGVAASAAGSAAAGALGGGGGAGGGIGSVISSIGSKIAGAVKSAFGFGSAAAGAGGSALASGAGAWTIGSGGAAAGAAGGAAAGGLGGLGALAGAAVPILGGALLFESLFGTSNKKWKGEMQAFHSAVQNAIDIDDTRGIKSVSDGMQAITLGSGMSKDALEGLKEMLGYTTTRADYFVYATDQVTGEKYLRVQDTIAGLTAKYDALIAKAQAANAAMGAAKMSAAEVRQEVTAQAQVKGREIAAKDKYERARGKGDGPYKPTETYTPKEGETYKKVLTELERRAQKVKIGTGKEAYYTTVGRQEDYAARQAKNKNLGRGKQYGGISSGPMSGHMALLHGREAVIPLADGNRLRAPIQVLGGGQGGSAELVPLLQQIADRLNRIYEMARRNSSGGNSGNGEILRELRALSEQNELQGNRLIRTLGRQSRRRLQAGGVGERVLA